MLLDDIKIKVDELGNAWEQFKQANDERLTQIESKGFSDPLLEEKVHRINNVIDDYQDRIQQLELVATRPAYDSSKNTASDNLSDEHKQAFLGYIRKGNDHRLQEIEQKALSVQSDIDGGYLITPTLSDTITKIAMELSPIRQLATVESISTDSLEILEDYGQAANGWTTETSAPTDTSTPQWSKKVIAVHEMYAQPKATQKLLDDTAFDVESWLLGKLTDAFYQTENHAFVKGDGNGKPRGMCDYPDGTSWGTIEQVSSGTSGQITADALLLLYYALKTDYTANAHFLMHRTTIQHIRMLKTDISGSQQYLWQPGLADGTPDQLLGVPVMQCQDMDQVQAGALAIALADFSRAYRIVDRMGLRLFRDPYTDKPFVKFYCTKRVGGDVTNFEAIKLLRVES